MNIFKLLLLSLLFMNISYGLELMSEDYPPYNYPNKDGNPEGISIDIVREIIKKTGDKDNITILPWSRSYKYIQEKKGQVLFVMTKTKERENLFKWVGPIASNNWVLFAKKNSKIKINSLEELKKSNYIIGTYNDDACELFLKKNHFVNIASVADDTLNVKKLFNNRIDFWIVGEYQGILKAKRLNLHKEIKKVFDVKQTELYIAFSKDVSDKIISKWQRELDILKENEKYQVILDKYLK
jgi:polar amino acid transport system substrate-binding protein